MILFSDIIRHNAFVSPERIALVIDGERVSYSSLYNMTRSMIVLLRERNLKHGDRIAIGGAVNINLIALINACLCTGVVPVLVNTGMNGEVLQYMINDANCKVFFTCPQEAEEIRKKVGDVAEVLPVWNTSDISEGRTEITKPDPDDEALVIYTSGSTGMPKGVRLSHRNIYWMQHSLRSVTPSFGPDSVNLVMAPWFVIVGIGYYLFGIYTGCKNIVLSTFHPLRLLDVIEKESVTNAFLPPVVISHIIELEEFESADLSSLRHIQYGGAGLPDRSFYKLCDRLNVMLTKGYGLSETSGIGTAFRFDDHAHVLSNQESAQKLLRSVGKPYEGVELEVRNEDGTIASCGDEGLICISGATIAMGYIGLESDKTKKWKDGWFETGDVGYLDESGYLYLTDRKEGLILSKGNNVYPATVEIEMLKHPDITNCVVVGLEHEEYGEVVGALIQANATVNEIAVRQWAYERLPDPFRPYLIVIADAMPLSPAGKIDRAMARKILKERIE